MGWHRSSVAFQVAVASTTVLGACSPLIATSDYYTSLGYPPSPARYSWMLPKTTINVTVVYTLNDCTDDRGGKLTISPAVTLTNTSEPDTDIGPDFPNGIVSIRPDQLKSFWGDSNVTVKTSSTTHILSYLGAQPTNETGPIIRTYLKIV